MLKPQPWLRWRIEVGFERPGRICRALRPVKWSIRVRVSTLLEMAGPGWRLVDERETTLPLVKSPPVASGRTAVWLELAELSGVDGARL